MKLRGTRAGAAVGVIIAVALAGCGAEPFEPNGATATEARARAWTEVDRTLTEVRGEREPIAQARFDGCHTGQNNWKIKDEYQHECSVAGSILVPAADLDGVSRALRTLSARLDELGCTTTWHTLAEIDRDYWARFRTRPDYRPGSLPETTYQCGDHRVTVAPTDSIMIKQGLRPTALLGLDERLDEQPYPGDTEQRARADGAAMFWMITATERYYATRF